MNIILALALYLVIGGLVLSRGMDHMRVNMLHDRDYRRMIRAEAKRDPAMVIAMLIAAIIWPLVMLHAILSRVEHVRHEHAVQ